MDTLDFVELSHGAQRRIMRQPDKEVLVRPKGHGWELMRPHNVAHRAALIAAGYRPVVHIPDLATWRAQPAPHYIAQYGRWGVVTNGDGTYTLRRTDCPITLRLTGADLTDATHALMQVEVVRQSGGQCVLGAAGVGTVILE